MAELKRVALVMDKRSRRWMDILLGVIRFARPARYFRYSSNWRWKAARPRAFVPAPARNPIAFRRARGPRGDEIDSLRWSPHAS